MGTRREQEAGSGEQGDEVLTEQDAGAARGNEAEDRPRVAIILIRKGRPSNPNSAMEFSCLRKAGGLGLVRCDLRDGEGPRVLVPNRQQSRGSHPIIGASSPGSEVASIP